MVFASAQELWQMAGHGPYVWFSFIASAVVLSALVFESQRRSRNARALVAAAARRRRAEKRI